LPANFPEATRRAVEMTLLRRLSVRERELVLLVAEGLSNKEIAGQLDISERTVETHVQSIFRKLGIHKRIRLAVLVNQLVDRLPE
jgi:DNA-binding NarL/FixJ family response regulator